MYVALTYIEVHMRNHPTGCSIKDEKNLSNHSLDTAASRRNTRPEALPNLSLGLPQSSPGQGQVDIKMTPAHGPRQRKNTQGTKREPTYLQTPEKRNHFFPHSPSPPSPSFPFLSPHHPHSQRPIPVFPPTLPGSVRPLRSNQILLSGHPAQRPRERHD